MLNRLATTATVPVGRCVALLATFAMTLADAAPLPPIVTRGGMVQESLVQDGVPPADGELAARLRSYLEARQATFLDWLPDGGLLVATRFADTEQLHRVASPLGTREQLTFAAEPVSMARVPQGGNAQGFVYLADHGGDENTQIYYYRFADHAVRRLTDGRSSHGAVQWSHDGRQIAFYRIAEDGVSHDVYVTEPATAAAPRRVLQGENATWYPLDWSLDDSRLLVLKTLSASESQLFIADVATGALTPVDAGPKAAPHGGPRGRLKGDSQGARQGEDRKVAIDAAKFSPDGRGVYLVSDRDSEFRQLRYVDLVTQETRSVTAQIPWDITAFDASPDGRYLAYVANVDGSSELTVVDTVQRFELALPPLPAGIVGRIAFDRTGHRLALSLDPASGPRDVYVCDLERGALERWTRSEAGPLDSRAFVAPELVRFPTWDRENGKPRRIPALLYRPRADVTSGPNGGSVPGAAAGRHPVLILLHGGPESQYRPSFDPFVQFLVHELGFIVVGPNVRGSSGYGKAYLGLDDGMLREDAVRDVGSLLVWLGLEADVDRDRIFVAGSGSYGGYLALASLAAYGDRLRGGVDVAGISDFVSFAEHSAAWRREGRRAEYGDERDPRVRAYLERISPLHRSASIRSPLLVVQGQNDPRTPAAGAELLVASLRGNGDEVWYLNAKDEGHAFRRKANRDAWLLAEASFLERWSAGGASAGGDTPALRDGPEH